MALKYPAGVHFDHTVGNVKVLIIMGGDNEHFARAFHFRQNFFIENPSERRVLVCCHSSSTMIGRSSTNT